MSDFFADSLKSFQKKSISSSIVDLITNNLLSGKLKPGDKLPTEIEFAKRLGVSRNTVREAIKMLSFLGIIEIKRGTGTFITRSMSSSVVNSLIISLIFEQSTPQELVELRILLDCGCAELASEKISSIDIQKLVAANNAFKREVEYGHRDIRRIRDKDLQFHEMLYHLSGNNLLAKIAKSVYRMFSASIEKAVAIDPLTGYEKHRIIIDALCTRDREAIRTAMQDSLLAWKKIINTKDTDS